MRSRVDIPEELITRSDHYIAWNELKVMIQESDLSNKAEILDILNRENTSTGNDLDSRIGALKAMDGGKTWRTIFNRYFVHMRNAYMVIVTERNEKYYIPEVSHPDTLRAEQMHRPGIRKDSSVVQTPQPADTMNMYVKTNVAGLGLLMANAGVEFDLGRYLSVNIPVYYSAVDYFVPTVKFRILSTQPELRVWPMTNRKGLYLGAHMGFAYYNFAFNGDWRYQDHDGKSPTLGGGLSVGYRLPITKSKKWNLEFGLGAGIYPLHYDVFYNLNDVRDGLLYETRTSTYIGLDNIHIGISYRIPMNNRNNND